MTRAWIAASFAAALVLGTACSSSDPEVSDGSDNSDDAVTTITDLPSACKKTNSSDATGEVAFIKSGRLYVADIEEGVATCVAEVGPKAPLTWSPDGSSFALSRFKKVEVYIDGEKRVRTGAGEDPQFFGYMRPDGDELLFIPYDGSKLHRVAVEGNGSKDISFLRRHDEVVSDPSGEELAVIGEPHGKPYGIFVVGADGEEAHRIVTSDEEDEFYGLGYSSDGETLYFVLDLHDKWELHSIPAEARGKLEESSVLVDSRLPFRPYLSTYNPDDIAYRDGECGAGFTTYILDQGAPTAVDDDGDSQPIGWTSDGSLVTGVADDLCDATRTLDIFVGDANDRDLLIEDVEEAAVRPAG